MLRFWRTARGALGLWGITISRFPLFAIPLFHPSLHESRLTERSRKGWRLHCNNEKEKKQYTVNNGDRPLPLPPGWDPNAGAPRIEGFWGLIIATCFMFVSQQLNFSGSAFEDGNGIHEDTIDTMGGPLQHPLPPPFLLTHPSVACWG